MRAILNLCWAVGLLLLLAQPAASQQEEQPEWQSLFDGESLEGWEDSDFVNPGENSASEGNLVIAAGQPMSGVTYTGEFPTNNYEIHLQAKRVEGHDFFCGLTVPVEESFCTLVMGGWGGNTTGISSIDGYDASENETSKYIDYDDDTWYDVRLRVAEGRLQVWIEELADEAEEADAEESEPVIDFPVAERNIDIRWEVEPSKPLGIATYSTTAALRQIEYRELPESP